MFSSHLVVSFLLLLEAAYTVQARLGEEADISVEGQKHRELGRKNCSWAWSTTSYYRICRDDDNSLCLKMTSTTSAGVGTWDSTTTDDDKDKMMFKFDEFNLASGGNERVRLTNKFYSHNLAASDIGGNDGASGFKISQSSGPCDKGDKVKISYLDPDGSPSNDYLKMNGSSLRWKSKSGDGSKFDIDFVEAV